MTRSYRRMSVGLLLIAVLSWASILPSNAEEAFAGEFLTLGVGARALAMGGAYAALAEDATASYWNPAGLGTLGRGEAAFMHSTLYGLDSYDYVSVAKPWGESVWGLSWLRVGIDDIIETRVPDGASPVSSTNRPERVETVSLSDNAFVLGWGKQVFRSEGDSPVASLYVGLAGKFLFTSAPRGTNAFGFGGDVGFLGTWRFHPKTVLRAAANVQDFTRTNLYWNTVPHEGEPSHRDTILPNVRLALALVRDVPPGDSRLTLTAETNSKYDFEMHYGAEWALGRILALRIGLLERKTAAATLRDLTAGAGFRLGFTGGQSFTADYAFTDGDLGGSHRVSLGMRF